MSQLEFNFAAPLEFNFAAPIPRDAVWSGQARKTKTAPMQPVISAKQRARQEIESLKCQCGKALTKTDPCPIPLGRCCSRI